MQFMKTSYDSRVHVTWPPHDLMALQMQPNLRLNMSKTCFLPQLISHSISHLSEGFRHLLHTQPRKLNSCLIYLWMPLKTSSNLSLHCHCLTSSAIISETIAAVSLFLKIPPLFKCLTAINMIFLKSLIIPYQSPAPKHIMAALPRVSISTP